MPARIVRRDINEADEMVRQIRTLFDEKLEYMFEPSEYFIHSECLRAIAEIKQAMTRPTVRIHRDKRVRKPRVHEDSSFRDIFKRLGRQAKTARKLKKLLHRGPAANDDELNALYQVNFSLRNIYRTIFLMPLDDSEEPVN